MIMEDAELKQKLFILDIKLNLVKDKLLKYNDLHYTFLETEAFNKIHRYGKEYYKNNYLKNKNKTISDFMKTFLYLKNTEDSLVKLKKYFMNDKKHIKSEMNQNE